MLCLEVILLGKQKNCLNQKYFKAVSLQLLNLFHVFLVKEAIIFLTFPYILLDRYSLFLQGRRKFYMKYLALLTFMNLIKRTVKNQDKKTSFKINFQKKRINVKKDEKEKK